MSEIKKPETQSGTAKGAIVALTLLTAMNFVNYLDRYILPAVQEQVKNEFHLTDERIGSLTFFFFVAYVCASPVTGWLGDRFPRKPMIVICALAIAGMNFLTAHVTGFWELNVRHMALGVGEACFGIFAPALIADFYAEDRRNGALTIFNVAIPVGSALGFLAGGNIAQTHGWRMAFIASAVPGVLVALLILVFMREPQRVAKTESHSVDKASAASLIKNGAYLTAILGYAAVTFALGGISVWMPTFLQRFDGREMGAAGTIMGTITVVCGLGGTIVGGLLAGQWTKKTGKALYYVPALSALLALPFSVLCFFGPKGWTLPMLGVAVFFIFLGTGPVNAATLNAVPANLRSAAMAGQLFALHVFGDMPSSWVIGAVSQHTNLRLGLAVTLVSMLVGGIIFTYGARYAPELHHNVEATA
ncbi:spinster family MFS transporter [Granulicella cerasi]|uniref:Spinster family MFS transporter n=1 Tax=Granulicella cerasi TaxID=741063 RepID=A0ABW1Z5D5_9BACT|nr:MFS transporter [Granulicella cerasi]